MGQQLHKIYKNILDELESSDDKTIDKPIKELLINNEKNKGLYENPIIKIGKDYKWTITHNKEHQHINIRALNKNSNSSSDYELSYEEEFIQCKLFDDRLTLITTNYIQIFAVDEKKNLIYVRYIRSHKLSIEGLKKSIKSIEKDYEAPEKCDLDQVKDKIEEIEKHMNNKLEKILAELKSNNK
ncbi:2058_t:CDS:2 [Entrophospora sp. SA101]|nr:14523_t:CDS:2 [Entrophospora sp. SA101]CAJ0834847.1 2058_t:CDS:2 [Entrophospora sp. SA101]